MRISHSDRPFSYLRLYPSPYPYHAGTTRPSVTLQVRLVGSLRLGLVTDCLNHFYLAQALCSLIPSIFSYILLETHPFAIISV